MGTLLLPVSEKFKKTFPGGVLILCYLLSFYLLTYAVKELPLAVVYASWSVQGIVLVIFFGLFLHRQSLPRQGLLGLVLIVIRVVVVTFIFRKRFDLSDLD